MPWLMRFWSFIGSKNFFFQKKKQKTFAPLREA
jgi:hypothetical protein